MNKKANYIETDTFITISSIIEGYVVTSIGMYAFQGGLWIKRKENLCVNV